MPQLIYRLSEINATHVAEAGGKGASLGELIQAKAPVPPGFVVSSCAFREYFFQGEPKRAVVDVIQRLNANQLSLAQARSEIQSCLEEVCFPEPLEVAVREAADEMQLKRVSVRSSATCEDSATSAWAGQLETWLDVSPDEITKRIRDCWLSLFSESALAYGATHGYASGEIAVAVVIQQMVASEISGIGFSVHPVTQEPDIQLIEACLGLGEAIVSGRIVPDQFIVERDSFQILESVIGEQKEALWLGDGNTKPVWQELDGRGSQPKISTSQVTEYAGILARLHDHYGCS